MLLRFRVANHRSVRDEQEFSLVAVPRQGDPVPAEGSVPPAVRVAAIYGPNASGKSSVISGIHYLTSALRHSYRYWDPTGGVPREPFLLNRKSRDDPSYYEIDFSFENVRYNYGFEVDAARVLTEWLYSYPHGKKRVLYDRSPDGQFYFGRNLKGENAQIARLTRDNALFLSVAASTSHDFLTSIFNFLTSRIYYADSTHNSEMSRLEWVREELQRDPEMASDVAKMLRVADLGLTGIELVAADTPGIRFDASDPDSNEQVEVEFKVEGGAYLPKPPNTFFASLEKQLGDRLRQRSQIRLKHQSEDPDKEFVIPLTHESAGTKAWLSLAGRILLALRHGETLIVDEIDSSLHPRLSATLIQLFKDESFNRRAGQLIFTTHDVSFLGTLLEENLLSRDEVWFTEKDSHGATSLYSLVDFKPRKEENVERGYLRGRYGALPIVDVTVIKNLLSSVVAPDENHAKPKRSSRRVSSAK